MNADKVVRDFTTLKFSSAFICVNLRFPFFFVFSASSVVNLS
jgi:hypothetical protein